MPYPPARSQAAPHSPWRSFTWQLLLAALALATLLIQGYHPLAEDGGLYVAGVEYTLHPTLFPHYTAFVTEHLRFSIFAAVVAALVRLTHLTLPWVLFAVELFSLWLLFFAARQLLRRCFAADVAQFGGLCLLAVWATLPVAGTSLLLFDPYVTARSLSTPLSLLATAFALDPWPPLRNFRWTSTSATKSLVACIGSLAPAALFHPLMAAYALAFIVYLRAARLRHSVFAFVLLGLIGVALAAAVHALAPPESQAVVAAEYSRYYWFLSQWRWFELLGLAGPLIVLVLLLRSFRRQMRKTTRSAILLCSASILCRASIALGLTATLVALLFAREREATHLVARLQPLRVFLLLYAVMTLLLGAALTQIAAATRRRQHSMAARTALATAPILIVISLAAIMFSVQRSTFPASDHLEFPGRTNPNPWTQAFLWARRNTPPDALFALDAKYINQPGEDAQTFRATTLRSALPDFSKDGGEAAITPSLASAWQQGAAAQVNLSTEPDAVRDQRLRLLGVTWMILHSSAPTHHPCPYDNGVVKVCCLGSRSVFPVGGARGFNTHGRFPQ